MKMILKYCRENNIKDITADDAWEIAKRIGAIAKKKPRREIYA